jgi:hypothetical protein
MNAVRAWPALGFALAACATAGAADYNVKVVTDGSPDYHDLPSMVRSITAKWPTPKEKCWAMFYWNHIARRQTTPMSLHGLELTDPIRQFNDYGFTMCSTISGVNNGIWEAMGLKHRFVDISNHTVCEVFYDDRWHMYDNSLSALYTLCDGVTLADVASIGAEGACAASGDKKEIGHVAKYHCLFSTSPNGFLMGADCARSLKEETGCFNPRGIKVRTYYYNWDFGHRYILNLKDGEVYTRHYRPLGAEPKYWVPNGGKDPEAANPRYRIRGNGVWTFKPDLTAAGLKDALHSSAGVTAAEPAGIRPAEAGKPGQAVFKVQSANVTTGMSITAEYSLKSADDMMKISVSTNNGLSWDEAWKPVAAGEGTAKVDLVQPVNGAYETLVRIELLAKAAPGDATLKSLEIVTTTEVNSKTQPRLKLGRNTVCVDLGEQTESIVFWPELQGGKYKAFVAEEKNVKAAEKHPEYMGAVWPASAKEEAYLIYRIDAPGDLARVTYGGRFYNRAPKSHLDLLHSFAGHTWTKSWSLTSTEQPWDVIHYETAAAPKGARSAWVKYLMNTTAPGPDGCSIYAQRIEANYVPPAAAFKPLEVTFAWSEVRKDRSLVKRSHTQLVEKTPFRYVIAVGGEDHPVMESLRVNLKGAAGDAKYGYSDGKDAGGEKSVGQWVTCGKNLATGKTYTLSVPSGNNWGAGDPDGRKLTDGVVGPPYAGGTSYQSGAIWDAGKNPVITLDLGAPAACASFGLNCHGYPFWDALKGEIKDQIEVLASDDGKEYRALGLLKTDLWWKDVPVNHMWTDEETMCGLTCRLIPEQPVTTRYVRYKITSGRFFCCTELEVLDSIKFEPFDLRLALPDER